MSDIDFEALSPSTPQANDALLVRRGAGAPNTGALVLTADMLARANHTGTQTAATISDFAAAVAATPSVTANTAKVTNATHTGDVTGATALTIANDVVTNAKLANMAQATIKGRAAGAGTGDPTDLTAAQATAILDTFTSAAKGLVPASGGGTTTFLRADGTFAAPPGGGSGDVVGPTGATDDRVAGFDGTTGKLIKQGTVTITELADIVAEIIAARGDRANLNNRLTAISNVITPNAGGFIVGQIYDQSFRANATTTLAGAANRMEMSPFMVSSRLRIDQIGVEVTTGVAGALAKVQIYSTGTDGWPDALLYESANLDCATNSPNFKQVAVDFTFDADRVYWLGVRHSATATLRAIPVTSLLNLGTASGSGNYFTVIRRTGITFANPAPDPWNFLTADRVTNATMPVVRMRAAAL